MLKVLIFCFTIIFSIIQATGEELSIKELSSIIILENDSTYYCNVIDNADDVLTVQLRDLTIKRIPKADVVSISPNPIAENTSSALKYSTLEPIYTKSNSLMGISFLSPGGINFVFGSINPDYGIRASGGYLFLIWGARLDLLIPTVYEEDYFLSLGPSLEYFSFFGVVDWVTLLGFVDMEIHGFDIGVGIGPAYIPQIDRFDFGLSLSIGYLGRSE